MKNIFLGKRDERKSALKSHIPEHSNFLKETLNVESLRLNIERKPSCWCSRDLSRKGNSEFVLWDVENTLVLVLGSFNT